MKKITSLILALVLTFSLVALSACGDKTTDDKNAAASDDKVITVGCLRTSSPPAPPPQTAPLSRPISRKPSWRNTASGPEARLHNRERSGKP